MRNIAEELKTLKQEIAWLREERAKLLAQVEALKERGRKYENSPLNEEGTNP